MTRIIASMAIVLLIRLPAQGDMVWCRDSKHVCVVWRHTVAHVEADLLGVSDIEADILLLSMPRIVAVAPQASIISPSSSPDGSLIAFYRFSAKEDAAELVVINSQTGEERYTRRIAVVQGKKKFYRLAWESDNELLYFTASRGGELSKRVNLPDFTLHRLTLAEERIVDIGTSSEACVAVADEKIATMQGHDLVITDLAGIVLQRIEIGKGRPYVVSPDLDTVAWATNAGAIVFETESARKVSYSTPTEAIHRLIALRGHVLYYVTAKGKVMSHDGTAEKTIGSVTDPFKAEVSLSPDNKFLLTCEYDSGTLILSLVDLETGSRSVARLKTAIAGDAAATQTGASQPAASSPAGG